MQFLIVFLQNRLKRCVFTRSTGCGFEPVRTGPVLHFSGARTATESPVFSSPVRSQSGFFPVLWTGLLNTMRCNGEVRDRLKFVTPLIARRLLRTFSKELI